MNNTVRIGTRDSKLAVWQAVTVQEALLKTGVHSELVFIRSEGDTNQVTPLYAIGVQGVFTKALDAALLNNEIDIAVHSMKDVPVQLAQGITQAAVLERGIVADVFIWNNDAFREETDKSLRWPATSTRDLVATGDAYTIEISRQAQPSHRFVIATSSIRRKAQWLHAFPGTVIEDIRGNINTRMRKTQESVAWNGAIFAAAGLERIGLASDHITSLGWMLPAPAQGAIIIVCRSGETAMFEQLQALNHQVTAICTKAERDFLKTLMGGCSTPISALSIVKDDRLHFEGNITKPDGSESITIKLTTSFLAGDGAGIKAGELLLEHGGKAFVDSFS
ncbi:MAG: hydroxymethylbilane synthase [Chitinophagaceae bacterium]